MHIFRVVYYIRTGFHIGFFVGGGGGIFWNSEIYIKHTLLGGFGPGGMPPQKVLTNHCPEIESGGVWQLADCS